MTHYVCTGGCQGVSDDAETTCQSVDCAKHTHPLTPCNCTDQTHAEAIESATTENGAATE